MATPSIQHRGVLTSATCAHVVVDAYNPHAEKVTCIITKGMSWVGLTITEVSKLFVTRTPHIVESAIIVHVNHPSLGLILIRPVDTCMPLCEAS